MDLKKGRKLLTCPQHGLTPTREACIKCWDHIALERKQLQQLVKQSPEFIQKLAYRNQEFVATLRKLVELISPRATEAPGYQSELLLEIRRMCQHVIFNASQDPLPTK